MDIATPEAGAGQPASTPVSSAPVAEAPATNAAPANAVADNGFAIPKDYAEAGWAKNLKSVDDVWKSLANAQTLIGKKTIGLPDWKDVRQTEEYLAKVRLGDEAAYSSKLEKLLPDEDDRSQYAKAMHDAGLNEYQLDKILSIHEAVTQTKMDKLFGSESFKADLMNTFGGDEAKVAAIHKEAVELFGRDFIDQTPNPLLLKAFQAIEKIKEQYGVKSLSAAVGAPAAVSESPETVAKQIDEQMSKMQQMKRAPHNSSDYANEQKRLNELYNKKFRLEGKL